MRAPLIVIFALGDRLPGTGIGCPFRCPFVSAKADIQGMEVRHITRAVREKTRSCRHSLSLFELLISVRSEVQLLPGPLATQVSATPYACAGISLSRLFPFGVPVHPFRFPEARSSAAPLPVLIGLEIRPYDGLRTLPSAEVFQVT